MTNISRAQFTYPNKGISKGRPLLQDRRGFQYTRKSKRANVAYWRYVIRNDRTNCQATVVERDGEFTQNAQTHASTKDMTFGDSNCDIQSRFFPTVYLCFCICFVSGNFHACRCVINSGHSIIHSPFVVHQLVQVAFMPV